VQLELETGQLEGLERTLEDEMTTNVNKARFEDVRWIQLAQNNA
jgi:hypothetical protein